MKIDELRKPVLYIVFVLITALWCFFLGFALGEKEAPETVMPFLATVLPEPQQRVDNITPVTENELTFTTILQKPNTPVVVPDDANVIEKDKKTLISSSQKPVQNILQKANLSEEAQFKFLLQLLAVQQRKSAEEYKEKLKNHNIKAEIIETSKNDISWYRIYTTFTGTVAQLNTFKDKLASLGIVDTILRERIPQ